MGTTVVCERCNGDGYIEVLVSQHDNKKETIKCTKCSGKGETYQMSDSDESDYWADYW
jgi:DnaJ-class molecular chaperone